MDKRETENMIAIMRALDQSIVLDLAIASMIVTTDLNVSDTVRGIVEGLGISFEEIDCPMAIDSDIQQMLHDPHSDDLGMCIMLTYPFIIDIDRLNAIVRLINDKAIVPVILVFNCDPRDEQSALEVIHRILEIHPAHVPTAKIGGHKLADRFNAKTFLLTGTLSLEGSKSGEFYYSLDVHEPYEHSVRFTLKQSQDQSDDDFYSFFEDRNASGDVAIRLTEEDGYLVCTTNDIDFI